MTTPLHGPVGQPSPWLLRWAHLLPRQGSALDLACGRGRHLRWLAGQGLQATGVDRDAQALAGLQPVAGLELVLADVEADPWPLPGRTFDAVLVFNYLWRPLWPQILAALAPGGLLICETFALGQQTVGRPSRPDFLLQAGELLMRCQGLRVLAYEDGFEHGPERFVQRVVAVRPRPGDSAPDQPPRYALQPTGTP